MRRIMISALAVLTALFCVGCAEVEAKKKNPVPEFAVSGRINGTELLYENLSVNSHGIAAVTIHNPTGTGISFNATFSFLDGKGQYLGGFTISAFAHKGSQAAYFENIDYRQIRTAKSVKVLGRAGRISDY